jgi:type IV secretory pathway TrbF-like protein
MFPSDRATSPKLPGFSRMTADSPPAPFTSAKRLPAPSEAALKLYALARKEWDDRLGTPTKAAANWRRAFFLMFASFHLCLGYNVYLRAQPKAVPYVIEIDRIGEGHYRGPVGSAAKNFTIPERAIRQQLRKFVSSLRTISSDPAMIKANILDAVDMATTPGQNLIAKKVQDHPPFKRAAEERVSVDVQSILASTRDTWQVDWKETRFDPTGTQLDSFLWRGVFRLVFRSSENGVTEEMLEKNPLGIYIEHFDWKSMQAANN